MSIPRVMAVQNTSREPHELIFEDLSLFKTIGKALFSNCFLLPCHHDLLNPVHSLKFPTFQSWFNLWDKSEVAEPLLEDDKSESYVWLKKKKRNEKSLVGHWECKSHSMQTHSTVCLCRIGYYAVEYLFTDVQ